MSKMHTTSDRLRERIAELERLRDDVREESERLQAEDSRLIDELSHLRAENHNREGAIAAMKRERDEAHGNFQRIAPEHKLMRVTLEALGEQLLVPGNWHPTEPIACRGIVAAARAMERERDEARALLRNIHENTGAALLTSEQAHHKLFAIHDLTAPYVKKGE